MLKLIPNLRSVRPAASAGFVLLVTAVLLLFDTFNQSPSDPFLITLHEVNQRFSDAPFLIAASGVCFLCGAVIEQTAETLFAKLRQRHRLGRDAIITFEEYDIDWKADRMRKSLDTFSDKGALDLGSAIYQYAERTSALSETGDPELEHLSADANYQIKMKLPHFIVHDISDGGFDAVLLMNGKGLSDRRSQLNSEASLRETVVLTVVPCSLAIGLRFGFSAITWLIGAAGIGLLSVALIVQANNSRQKANDVIAAAMRAELIEIPQYPVFR